MSDAEAVPSAPDDLLAGRPETAYFWGRVAGDGDVTESAVELRTTDEKAARRLAAVAGAERVDCGTSERDYAHDTAVTRTEDEYTVQVFGETLSDRAGAALGLPLDDQPGGYRFDAFADHDRQLVRGLLEGCGTVCFKRSSGAVGISFAHEDRTLVETIRRLVDRASVGVPTDEVSEASSGRYWFGVDDAAAARFGEWVYDGAEESGLFSPKRRRKLERSLERADSDR